MEQVASGKVGESGTYIIFITQAVWSTLIISLAIKTMMILVESVRLCRLCSKFIIKRFYL